MSFNITLTNDAIQAIKAKLEVRKTPNAFFRVGVVGSGCNGYKLFLSFEDQIKGHDLQFPQEGITVLVDKKSIVLLDGSVVDYEKTLMGEGFKIFNPQEDKSCGCGKSFSIKPKQGEET